jgi:hypothetical protein
LLVRAEQFLAVAAAEELGADGAYFRYAVCDPAGVEAGIDAGTARHDAAS